MMAAYFSMKMSSLFQPSSLSPSMMYTLPGLSAPRASRAVYLPSATENFSVAAVSTVSPTLHSQFVSFRPE